MKKIILFTGASSGIGKHIYEKINTSYTCVVIQRRNMGYEHEFTCDLGDLQELEKVLETIEKKYKIDILLLNAGIYLPDTGGFSDFVYTNQVNYFANVMILQKFVPRLEKIILISSIAARCIDACNSLSYGSSKIAIEYYCRCLRERLRSASTRVIIVSPGAIETPIFPDSLLKKYGKEMMKVSDFSDMIVRLIQDESTVIQEEIVCRPLGGTLDFTSE